MKLYFMHQDALDILENCIEKNIYNYKSKDIQWISDLLSEYSSTFLEFKYEANDFSLDMSNVSPAKTDIENIKRIYTNLKFLSETQAADERLWAGLTHNVFWKYMQYRWPVESAKNEINFIKSHYFYEGKGKRRNFVFNGLSRLWWAGKYTYDEKLENPFELTEYLFSHKDTSETMLFLLSSNCNSNKTIRLGMIKAIINFEKTGKKTSKKVINEMSKYLNIVGGTYLLDCFNEEEIYDMCYKKLKETYL